MGDLVLSSLSSKRLLTLERKYFPYPLDKGVQVTALRVEQSAPFSVVGIDFGGPLYTKDENKHYIVLFTCVVTRALHLELVNNLTTEMFLLALRRFISRRGLCSKILTDNARTFKRSDIELKNLWKVISDPTLKAFYASHKIYWQFIIKRAPWLLRKTHSNSKACFTKDCAKREQLYFAMNWRLF
ncbi:integrase catalytic domain-containing protein [Trichonephila inaurata madagascariensis]|uniref:Integrase catalytic domain-containing protein n=1 Tax=Trichonephila inaurata madagascariensis TaxID=2747483 RepID=A0A8X7BZX1_9ARAC|nr:integrase catalytic domain-containing protein [Trichonephila inaurata madagascariensis]